MDPARRHQATAHQSVNRLCRHIKPQGSAISIHVSQIYNAPGGKPDATPVEADPVPVRQRFRKCCQLLPKSAYSKGQTEDPNTYFSGATRIRLPERNRNRNALGWTQVPALLPSICRSGFRTCKLLRTRPNPVTPQGIGNGSYYSASSRRRALISVISSENRLTTN